MSELELYKIREFIKNYDEKKYGNCLHLFDDEYGKFTLSYYIIKFFNKYNNHDFIINLAEMNNDCIKENPSIKIINESIEIEINNMPLKIIFIHLYEDYKYKYPYLNEYKKYMKTLEQRDIEKIKLDSSNDIDEYNRYLNSTDKKRISLPNVFLFNKVHYLVFKEIYEKEIKQLTLQKNEYEKEILDLKFRPGGIGYEQAENHFYELAIQ